MLFAPNPLPKFREDGIVERLLVFVIVYFLFVVK